jgi:hypothetical protein
MDIVRYYDRIISKSASGGKLSQNERILRMIYEANLQGKKLPLPEILKTMIAGHTARISELRQMGIPIICDEEWVDGQIHSCYYIGGLLT